MGQKMTFLIAFACVGSNYFEEAAEWISIQDGLYPGNFLVEPRHPVVLPFPRDNYRSCQCRNGKLLPGAFSNSFDGKSRTIFFVSYLNL